MDNNKLNIYVKLKKTGYTVQEIYEALEAGKKAEKKLKRKILEYKNRQVPIRQKYRTETLVIKGYDEE